LKLPATEFETAQVPPSIWIAKPLHIDEIQEGINDFPDKITSGRTFLKVVAYPWGVEFDVCGVENEL
jgi:hypothetical protein